MIEQKIGEQLGRIGYEHYCIANGGVSASSGKPLPTFDEIPVAARAGWSRAALAILVASAGGVAGVLKACEELPAKPDDSGSSAKTIPGNSASGTPLANSAVAPSSLPGVFQP